MLINSSWDNNPTNKHYMSAVLCSRERLSNYVTLTLTINNRIQLTSFDSSTVKINESRRSSVIHSRAAFLTLQIISPCKLTHFPTLFVHDFTSSFDSTTSRKILAASATKSQCSTFKEPGLGANNHMRFILFTFKR